MAIKIYTLDDQTGQCQFRELVPYTGVTSLDGSVTVVQSAGANGRPMFDVSVDGETITTLVANGGGSFTYTSEDGTVTIIPAAADDVLTTMADNGNSTFRYTNEIGTIVTIRLCDLVSDAPDTGLLIGG